MLAPASSHLAGSGNAMSANALGSSSKPITASSCQGVTAAKYLAKQFYTKLRTSLDQDILDGFN
jgi:hypothetical protein